MKAILKPFFGVWIIQIGESLWPKMFTKKAEALKVLNELNQGLNG